MVTTKVVATKVVATKVVATKVVVSLGFTLLFFHQIVPAGQ